MRNLDDTITRMAAFRARVAKPIAVTDDRLSDLDGFGSNPGKLRARTYVPEGLSACAPLVVVMHGCTQNAAAYDIGAGWSALADEHGFALLFPEQRRANNANLCFNWFEPDDARRGSGEALSIKQMIDKMIGKRIADPARIFATGLSAGGGMTAAMLAVYPEVFAGGAVIAGLPFGTARSVPEAFDRMRGTGGPSRQGLAALVRGASGHMGPWPKVSVWHGSGDNTVVNANAQAIVDQWAGVHGIETHAATHDWVDGYPRRRWMKDGACVIEAYDVTGMGHGTPLATKGPDGLGVVQPHMIEAGISSTRHIAASWGLAPLPVARARPMTHPRAEPQSASPSPGVAKVIDDALRAAGLVR